MLTREQATVIADAINRLRPAWTHDELMAAMGDSRIKDRRTPRDVAAALAWMALDIGTAKPSRLAAPGQWWATADWKQADGPVPPNFRPLEHDDCHDCGRSKTAHPIGGCTYTAPPRGPVDTSAHMAAIRASYAPPAESPTEEST